MRADGHHQQGLDLWPDHRPARRECVGGRSGRRGEDHAVASPPGQRPAVDLDYQVKHPPPARLLHGCLVERPGSGDDLAVDLDRHVNRHPLLDRVGAGYYLVDGLGQVLRLRLGQEADMAQVDPQQRHAGPASEFGRPEQGAVPADDQDHLGPGGSSRRDGNDRGGLTAQISAQIGRLWLQDADAHPGRGQPGDDRSRAAPGRGAASMRRQQHRAAAVGPARTGPARTGLARTGPARGLTVGGGRASAHRADAYALRGRHCGPAEMASRNAASSSDGAPRRSHRKYSTFPDGPGSGLAVTPRTPSPLTAAAAATAVTAASRSAGSLTTPPAPTLPLPTSNWGFTRSTKSASGAAQATRAGSTMVSEINDRSAVTRPGAGATCSGRRPRTLTRSRIVTRGSVRSDQASCP